MNWMKLGRHRLIQDTAILFGVQISGYVLPLVTLPYLTRILGPANFGLLALGTALILYFVGIIEYGFGVTATRQVAVSQADVKAVSRIFSTVLVCRLALTLGCFAALALLLVGNDRFGQYRALYLVSFLQALGWFLSPNWLLQGMQQMRMVAWADYGAKIISVLLIFLLVKTQEDYLLAAAVQSGAFLVSALIGMGIVMGVLGLKLVRPAREEIIAAFIDGWPVFLSMASSTIITSSNTLILGWAGGSAQVGYFNAATRITIAARALANPIASSVYPHISKLVKESRAEAIRFLQRKLLWTTLPFLALSLGMAVFAPFGVRLIYGSQYEETGKILQILSPVPFVHAVSMCFGTNYMLAFGYEKQWSKIIQRILILNFVCLGLLLLVAKPIRAVAISSVLMDVYAASACIWFYWRTELLAGQHEVDLTIGESGKNI